MMAMQIHGNKMIWKLLFLVLTPFLVLYASESEIQVFSYVPGVEIIPLDTEIVAGNIVRLKIRARGDRVAFPNIDEIDGVQVLEQYERVTNKYHYINGVLNREKTTLILTFAPHRDVTLPPYSVEIDGKIYKTKPYTIKVIAANAQNAEDGNKFFIYLETDKKFSIVGEPIIATLDISLKFGLNLLEKPKYGKPLFKGFFSKMIGDEKVYTKGNRQITEVKYLLIPQSEGNFNVGPARAKISILNKHKLDMFGRVTKADVIPIASRRVKVEVVSKPKESDLVGNFVLKNSLDSTKVQAGKPVKLTIKIEGDGSLEDFEFPDFEIDNVTVYSEDAVITADLNGTTLHSTYSKRFAFISNRNFIIPARSISAYDTKSKTVSYLKLPSYDIDVKGSQAIAIRKSQDKLIRIDNKQKSMLDSEDEEYLSEAPSLPYDHWLTMVLVFTLGVLLISILYVVISLYRKMTYFYRESEALKILYAHTSESKEVESMVKKLYAKKNGDKTVYIDKKALKLLVECFVSKLD